MFPDNCQGPFFCVTDRHFGFVYFGSRVPTAAEGATVIIRKNNLSGTIKVDEREWKAFIYFSAKALEM